MVIRPFADVVGLRETKAEATVPRQRKEEQLAQQARKREQRYDQRQLRKEQLAQYERERQQEREQWKQEQCEQEGKHGQKREHRKKKKQQSEQKREQLDQDKEQHELERERGPKRKPSEQESDQNEQVRDFLQNMLQLGKQLSYPERFKTFENWPRDNPIPAWKCAEAGFVWDGENDEIFCTVCGIALFDFEEGDDPTEEGDDPWTFHARMYPPCDFLEQEMGIHFIMKHQIQLIHDSRNKVSQSLKFKTYLKYCKDAGIHVNDRKLARENLTSRQLQNRLSKHLSYGLEVNMPISEGAVKRKLPNEQRRDSREQQGQEMQQRELEREQQGQEKDRREQEMQRRESDREQRELEREQRGPEREQRGPEREQHGPEKDLREQDMQRRESEREQRELEREQREPEREQRGQERNKREPEREQRGQEKEQRGQERVQSAQERNKHEPEREQRGQGREQRGQEREQCGQERKQREPEREQRGQEREQRGQEREQREPEREQRGHEKEQRGQEREQREPEREQRGHEREQRGQEREQREPEREQRGHEREQRGQEREQREPEREQRGHEREQREQEREHREPERKQCGQKNKRVNNVQVKKQKLNEVIQAYPTHLVDDIIIVARICDETASKSFVKIISHLDHQSANAKQNNRKRPADRPETVPAKKAKMSCDVCGKLYITEHFLQKHISKEHKSCKECGETFDAESSLTEHRKSCGNRNAGERGCAKCERCGAVFAFVSSLEDHQRTCGKPAQFWSSENGAFRDLDQEGSPKSQAKAASAAQRKETQSVSRNNEVCKLCFETEPLDFYKHYIHDHKVNDPMSMLYGRSFLIPSAKKHPGDDWFCNQLAKALERYNDRICRLCEREQRDVFEHYVEYHNVARDLLCNTKRMVREHGVPLEVIDAEPGTSQEA